MKVSHHTEYTLDTGQTAAVIAWLMGRASYRELGDKLDMSHQGAVNAVANICRQWIREGKLKFDDVEPRK